MEKESVDDQKENGKNDALKVMCNQLPLSVFHTLWLPYLVGLPSRGSYLVQNPKTRAADPLSRGKRKVKLIPSTEVDRWQSNTNLTGETGREQ